MKVGKGSLSSHCFELIDPVQDELSEFKETGENSLEVLFLQECTLISAIRQASELPAPAGKFPPILKRLSEMSPVPRKF